MSLVGEDGYPIPINQSCSIFREKTSSKGFDNEILILTNIAGNHFFLDFIKFIMSALKVYHPISPYSGSELASIYSAVNTSSSFGL